MNMPLPPEVSSSEPASTSALRDPLSHLVFWSVAVGMLVFDLWSKAWAFSSLTPIEERIIIPGWLTFRRSLNDGAVFGSFTGYVGVFIAASLAALLFVLFLFSRSGRRHFILHVALGCILAGALGNLYDRTYMRADVVSMSRGGEWGTVTIGVVKDDSNERTLRVGAFPEGTHVQTFPQGEVRVHQQGVVRDFIKFVPRFPKGSPVFSQRDVWPWVFNIADSALVCGVIVMLLGTWTEHERRERPAVRTRTTSGAAPHTP